MRKLAGPPGPLTHPREMPTDGAGICAHAGVSGTGADPATGMTAIARQETRFDDRTTGTAMRCPTPHQGLVGDVVAGRTLAALLLGAWPSGEPVRRPTDWQPSSSSRWLRWRGATLSHSQ